MIEHDKALKKRCCVPGAGRQISQTTVDQQPFAWPHGPGNYCLGDVCMAWRWVSKKDAADITLGYCGIAGGSAIDSWEILP